MSAIDVAHPRRPVVFGPKNRPRAPIWVPCGLVLSPFVLALILAGSLVAGLHYAPLADVNERLQPVPAADGCYLTAYDLVKRRCGGGVNSHVCWNVFGLYSYNASGVSIRDARISEGIVDLVDPDAALRRMEARHPYGYRPCFVDSSDPTTVYMDNDLSHLVKWRYTQIVALFSTVGVLLALILACFCVEYKRSPLRQLYHRCRPAPDPWEWELAFLMGTHARAGAKSPLLALRRDKLYDHHVLGLVLDFVSADLPHPARARFHRGIESSRSLNRLVEPWTVPAPAPALSLSPGLLLAPVDEQQPHIESKETVVIFHDDVEMTHIGVPVSIDAAAGDSKRSAVSH